MAYRQVALAQNTVKFIMSSHPDLIALRGHYTRVRRYQSQHDVDSVNYRFWKEVGDLIHNILWDMELDSQSSEKVIRKIGPVVQWPAHQKQNRIKLDRKQIASGEKESDYED
jgi:hypothetical protein